MKFILDTNAAIAVIARKNAGFLAELRRHHVADIAVSSVTLFELYWGVYNGSPAYFERNMQQVNGLRFEVLPFDREAAQHAGRIRVETKAQKIGAYDLLIAAQAVATGRVLVTHNVSEFKRVPGMAVQDWES